MAFSKESRIKLFIAVDVVFFLIELVIGYWAHSLALVADAFHMLNDVISLCVGLWAVRVATTRGSSNEMTYGWARAEILGGLVNGVFLVALCLTIFLEAIQRFFEPQEVTNPKMVLVVGAIGLLFNILGLFVFHQHSHSHDHEHEHEHSETNELGTAEEGHAHAPDPGVEATMPVEDINGKDGIKATPKAIAISWNVPNGSLESGEVASPEAQRRLSRLRRLSINSARRAGSNGRNIEDLPVSPWSIRDNIISRARGQEGEDDSEDENSPVLQEAADTSRTTIKQPDEETPLLITHSNHQHTKPRKKGKGGGHNHDDMNIRGLFLHALGDALGNVGVMATALIIWLTAPWYPRFYFDPAISLVITGIILKTAIPLCLETARPLLQAVPEDISVDDVKQDIESLPGIISCHHVHVWALTPSKRIATMDVVMNFKYDVSRYMQLAKEIKSCLQAYGIHSSTIQPEFSDADVSCQLDSAASGDVNLKCCTPGGSSGTATPKGDGHSQDHDHVAGNAGHSH